MRRPASIGVAVALFLSSFPGEAMAQVVRSAMSVTPMMPSISLPLSSPSPLLNSGLPLSSPSLSLSVPILAAPAITFSVTPKANPEAVNAVALPILNAVKAAKPQPPKAAPNALTPSASVLFDGISARPAASTGDPVVPGEDPSSTPPSLSRGSARPVAPLHLEPGSSDDHHDHAHPKTANLAHESALKRAMAVALTFIAVEMIGGAVTGSAALTADAFHLLADQVIVAAALFSSWLARKPGGYPKVEGAVGLLAAAVIAFTGIHMGVEAWERFFAPGAAATWNVALFALASLGANLSSALILRRHSGNSLSVKSAFLVAMIDTVGSIGVILSAAAAILLGWGWAEPVVVALIGAMIVKISWGLGKPAWKTLVAPRR